MNVPYVTAARDKHGDIAAELHMPNGRVYKRCYSDASAVAVVFGRIAPGLDHVKFEDGIMDTGALSLAECIAIVAR